MNSPASKIPIGCDKPSNATDIPSNPADANSSTTSMYLPEPAR